MPPKVAPSDLNFPVVIFSQLQEADCFFTFEHAEVSLPRSEGVFACTNQKSKVAQVNTEDGFSCIRAQTCTFLSLTSAACNLLTSTGLLRRQIRSCVIWSVMKIGCILRGKCAYKFRVSR